MGMRSRRDAVADLVHLRKSLDASIAAIAVYPWDSEEELVTLGPPELRLVLGLFLEGRIGEDDLEGWANAVESREDICFHPKDEIIDLVTELANPLLFTRLTRDSVMQMIGRLTDVDPQCGE